MIDPDWNRNTCTRISNLLRNRQADMYEKGQVVLELRAGLQQEAEANHQDESNEAALELPPAWAPVQQVEPHCWAG